MTTKSLNTLGAALLFITLTGVAQIVVAAEIASAPQRMLLPGLEEFSCAETLYHITAMNGSMNNLQIQFTFSIGELKFNALSAMPSDDRSQTRSQGPVLGGTKDVVLSSPAFANSLGFSIDRSTKDLRGLIINHGYMKTPISYLIEKAYGDWAKTEALQVGEVLYMPAGAKTFNILIQRWNQKVKKNGGPLAVWKAIDQPGGAIPDLDYIKIFAQRMFPIAPDALYYHLHDVNDHSFGFAFLPEEIHEMTSPIINFLTAVLEDPVLKENKKLMKLLNYEAAFISGEILDSATVGVRIRIFELLKGKRDLESPEVQALKNKLMLDLKSFGMMGRIWKANTFGGHLVLDRETRKKIPGFETPFSMANRLVELKDDKDLQLSETEAERLIALSTQYKSPGLDSASDEIFQKLATKMVEEFIHFSRTQSTPSGPHPQ